MNNQVGNERRVAVVTGGAKRVGRAICLRLAEEGFDVGFTYWSSGEEVASLLAEIEGRGRRGVAVRADLSLPGEGVEAIASEFGKVFSRLDLLVNNASVYERSGLDVVNVGQMRRFLAVHVESPLMLCQRFEGMLRASGGCVVNMVDLLAEKPWPEYLGYCASKAGLWNLTLGLARALAPEARVNAIAPGVVEWPAGYPASEQEKYLKRVPLGRAGTPAEVAEAVVFLANAKYVTGQILRLDGGRSLT